MPGGKSKFFKYLLMIALTTLAVFILAKVWIDRNCGFVLEVRAYTSARNDVYFWGRSYCPAASSLKKADQDVIKNLPKDKKSEVIAKNGDGELEKILTETFLGYNKYVVGEGKNTFVVYETICKPCELR